MLLLHEVHRLDGDRWADFERLVRDELLPALAATDTCRLAWCAASMPGSIGHPEAITMTAVTDGAALEQLGERMREGELRELSASLAGLRTDVQHRILKPLSFDPLRLDFDAIPTVPQDGPAQVYMHDFVPPRIGRQRDYEAAMQKIYMALSDDDLSDVVLWAGLETIAGGGPVPESVNISAVRTHATLVSLLANEIPREAKEMNTWMQEALTLRDTWTTRLVVAAPWSPIR